MGHRLRAGVKRADTSRGLTEIPCEIEQGISYRENRDFLVAKPRHLGKPNRNFVVAATPGPVGAAARHPGGRKGQLKRNQLLVGAV